MDLLDKTREINRLIQKAAGEPVDFDNVAEVLTRSIECNTYIASRKGKILGSDLLDDFECELMLSQVLEEGYFPEDYNNWLLDIDETSANFEQQNGKCVFVIENECLFEDKLVTVVPITAGEMRLGTLVLARFGESFEDEDLILAEYGATVVAMEILRARSDRVEEQARKKAEVQVAVGTLSHSELEAVQHLFAELEGDEGLIVASDIADRIGISRSIFVNALNKFESAGVIESRSLGMKGTYIKVLNNQLFEEIDKLS